MPTSYMTDSDEELDYDARNNVYTTKYSVANLTPKQIVPFSVILIVKAEKSANSIKILQLLMNNIEYIREYYEIKIISYTEDELMDKQTREYLQSYSVTAFPTMLVPDSNTNPINGVEAIVAFLQSPPTEQHSARSSASNIGTGPGIGMGTSTNKSSRKSTLNVDAEALLKNTQMSFMASKEQDNTDINSDLSTKQYKEVNVDKRLADKINKAIDRNPERAAQREALRQKAQNNRNAPPGPPRSSTTAQTQDRQPATQQQSSMTAAGFGDDSNENIPRRNTARPSKPPNHGGSGGEGRKVIRTPTSTIKAKASEGRQQRNNNVGTNIDDEEDVGRSMHKALMATLGSGLA